MFRVLMELDSSSRENIMIDLADIAPTFLFLVDKGFVTKASSYRPKEFGNAVLETVGTLFSIQFKRDRGQVFVEIGSDAVGWHSLEYVLEFVDNSITQQRLGEPPDVAVMADLLQLNWAKVAHLFGDSQKILQLQAFAKQKSAALLNGIFFNHKKLSCPAST
jgi:hypothetical protein